MMSVKRFLMNSGERFAILMNSEKFPENYQNLYSVIYLRNRGQSINTIVAVLEDIKLLYQLFDKLEINIEERVKSKNFLTLSEIESLVNLASFNRKYLLTKKSDKKILSFQRNIRKEAIRSKFILCDDYVSSELISRRITNFAEYLEWFESFFHSSSITSTKKAFKSRRPKKAINRSIDYKSFDEEQLKKILSSIDPQGYERIWNSDYINYRNELIIYLFLYLGCRKGELLNIKLLDLPNEIKGNYLTIMRNHNDKNDSRLYQPLVKTNSRSIAVNLKLKQKLENYIIKYRSTVFNAELSDFLILSNKGQALSISALNKIFEQISNNVSFNVHAHAFRHTWNDKFTERSSVLIASGETTEAKVENDRAYLMGWVSGSKSASRYSKRSENLRAIKFSLEIQKKFEENLYENNTE